MKPRDGEEMFSGMVSMVWERGLRKELHPCSISGWAFPVRSTEEPTFLVPYFRERGTDVDDMWAQKGPGASTWFW